MSKYQLVSCIGFFFIVKLLFQPLYISKDSAFSRDRLDGIKIADLLEVFLQLIICFCSVNMLVYDVLPILKCQLWLKTMADGARAYFERNVRHWMDTHFHNKLIGRGGPITWPAQSPDLTPCDFFLWGYMKNKVYKTMPENTDELAQTIRHVMSNISQQYLCKRGCSSSTKAGAVVVPGRAVMLSFKA